MKSVFKLEVGENAKTSRCDCCGAESATGHGFIYRDEIAYAVYFAGWSYGHRQNGVSMAIAVGRWDDSSTVHDRVCFGVEAQEGEKQILFRIIDPDESPWPQTELLGDMISRDEARISASRDDAISIAEQIVRNHPAVCEFLRLSP